MKTALTLISLAFITFSFFLPQDWFTDQIIFEAFKMTGAGLGLPWLLIQSYRASEVKPLNNWSSGIGFGLGMGCAVLFIVSLLLPLFWDVKIGVVFAVCRFELQMASLILILGLASEAMLSVKKQ